jgi:multiple sugar transport system substrate-binding protein
MLDKKLSRRDLLKMMGLATAGAFLAACGTPEPEVTEEPMGEETTEAPPEQPAYHVIMMYNANELSDDEIALFNDKYAPISLERIDTDLVKMFSMLAAGQQCDCVRLYGTYTPSYVSKGVCLDLSDFFAASTIVAVDDLLESNNLYVVKGKRYGMVKDWSPDNGVFINKSVWEEMGVPLPDSPTADVNYREWRDLSSKLTKKEGDRTVILGTDFTPNENVMMWLTTTFANPASLFSDDMTKMVLLGNPDTKEAATFWLEWLMEGGVPSSINPFPSGSWSGVDWQQRQCATIQYGYWFSGMAVSENVPGDDIYMMKAPTWGPTYANPCVTGCGMFVTSQTGDADATWKVFEWFMGEEPCDTRATSGWGVPGLKSKLELMPREEPWRQQCYEVVNWEIENSNQLFIDWSPYCNPDALKASWGKFQDLVLSGDMSIDDMLAEVEAEVNVAIEEGMAASL